MDKPRKPETSAGKERRKYGKPRLRVIELTLEESLATSCKNAGACDLPPLQSFAPGS